MEFNKPYAVMGIVNVTADSFYDGGRYADTAAAVEHSLRLIGDGADIIDIGGSSTRPGAMLSTPESEIARVVPVIEGVARCGTGVPISVDTTWSATAKAAIEAGASWVNDVSGGRFDPNMAAAVADMGCAVVVMHSRGMPDTMQDGPRYADVVGEVACELAAAVEAFWQAGVSTDNIIVDPGFGFAKSVQHNIDLLDGLGKIASMGFPLLVGVSRKSFIGAITGRHVDERLSGSLAAAAAAYGRGASIFRVHDVRKTADFLKVLAAVGGVGAAGVSGAERVCFGSAADAECRI
ncbi:MAG: dihydropteroate synthase [Chitinispirillales bacterium]|nr:dihydropteroate synthase [Chitinispirillales bacterium]